MRDSYSEFINGLGIDYETFLDWGIENTIYPSDRAIDEFWTKLKKRILTGDQVYIRGYGRNGNGNDILTDFYSSVDISVKIDPSNNLRPTQNLQLLTGMKKNENIYNYQVAHIFGKTKNAFLFESPWNICYVPKIFDPLTGHESRGRFSVDYKVRWMRAIYKRYRKYIEDYNRIMEYYSFPEKLHAFLSSSDTVSKYTLKQCESFRGDMLSEFSQLKSES